MARGDGPAFLTSLAGDTRIGLTAAELQRELPFLATTKLLLALVKRGVGREDAHAAVKEHALAARGDGPAFLTRLADDPRIGLTAAELETLVGHPLDLAGAAPTQVASFAARVEEVAKRHPAAASYEGADVL